MLYFPLNFCVFQYTNSTCITGSRYIIHFYCLAVEADFYTDVVECLPVDPATWVRFLAGAGKIFSLYDNWCQKWYEYVNINTTHSGSLGEKVIYALSKIFIKFASVTHVFTIIFFVPVLYYLHEICAIT